MEISAIDSKITFSQSIRSKIVLLMMLVSLIPIILLSVFVYFSMSNSQQSASDSIDETRMEMQENVIATSLENQASAMALEMTGTTGNQILDLIQIMTATMIIGLDDTSSISMYLFAQLMILDDYEEFTLADPEGTILATTNLNRAPGDGLWLARNLPAVQRLDSRAFGIDYRDLPLVEENHLIGVRQNRRNIRRGKSLSISQSEHQR